MVMPSASLTLGDKILIQMVSGLLFFVSAVWCGHQRIRSIGIANFPLGFALFCKFARPFAAAEIREQLFRERKEEKKRLAIEKAKDEEFIAFYENPLDDPSFATKCLVWSMVQLGCVISGLFNWYPSIVIKGALVFHILMTVQDSIETRPMIQQEKELKRQRQDQLQLESAVFWKFFLPKPVWRWMGFEAIVAKATGSSSIDADPAAKKKKPPKLIRKVQKTKKIARGKRETAAEDLIWGALQIAYVILDLTSKQAIGTAILVYLCTLLEDILVVAMDANSNDNESHSKNTKDWNNNKIDWFKISWILVCLYLNVKWFFS